MLALIGELKEKILFTDFEALSQDVSQRCDALNQCTVCHTKSQCVRPVHNNQ